MCKNHPAKPSVSRRDTIVKKKFHAVWLQGYLKSKIIYRIKLAQYEISVRLQHSVLSDRYRVNCVQCWIVDSESERREHYLNVVHISINQLRIYYLNFANKTP